MDYFGGPLLIFNITIQLDGHALLNDASKIFQNIVPYYEMEHGITGKKDPVYPVRDTKYLIKAHDLNSVDRTFVLFIDEYFYVYILDYTYHEFEEVIERFKADLMQVIKLWLGYTDPGSIFCSSLNLVKQSNTKQTYYYLFMLPCSYDGQKSFLIWMNIYRFEAKFTVSTFAHETDAVYTDKVGKNSLSTIEFGNKVYIASSSMSNIDCKDFIDPKTCTNHANYLKISVFDIRLVNYYNIKLLYTIEYDSTDFIDPRSPNTPLQQFNIRDIDTYEVPFLNSSDPSQSKYNFIVSCYNNGLLFFKLINYQKFASSLNESDPDEPMVPPGSLDLLEITYKYNLIGIGRIFSEKEYNLNETTFRFFVSQPSPSIVYEFLIDEHLNVDIRVMYQIFDIDSNRYFGNDMITVTKDWVAILLYDYQYEQQIVRIYHRDESEFSMAHVELNLYEFGGRVSAISFLGWEL